MTDTRTDALKSLKLFAGGIIPSRLMSSDYEPTRSDAVDLQNDLIILARKVDKVILAYGVYLLENGIVSAGDVADHFTDVLENALHGNALYVIESRIEEKIQERHNAA